MKRIDFEKRFQELCDKHGIVLFLHDPKVGSDNGYAMFNEVHLGNKYKNVHIYMAVAFHEFGHAIINTKREKGVKRYGVSSTFHEEFEAWGLAQRYYARYIGRPFTKDMGNFALQCLKTHSKTHYAFKDIFKDDMK